MLTKDWHQNIMMSWGMNAVKAVCPRSEWENAKMRGKETDFRGTPRSLRERGKGNGGSREKSITAMSSFPL